MRRLLALTIAASRIALGGVAAAETLPCKQDPRLIQQCFAVHGRLSVHANMRPYLWPIGTNRLLGVAHSSLMRARRNSRERGMPCLFLNTERGFGGKPPQKSGFRRHLAGSKMPKEGSKMPKEAFFTAISRWRVVSRRALDASGFR